MILLGKSSSITYRNSRAFHITAEKYKMNICMSIFIYTINFETMLMETNQWLLQLDDEQRLMRNNNILE